VLVVRGYFGSRLQCQPRLATAARSRQRKKLAARQQLFDVLELARSADEAGALQREIVMRFHGMGA
jgi:hypothetical protein